MKTKLALISILAWIAFSCGDDESPYNCKSCINEPEAIAANDGSGKGIYKGLVVGSSGTIKFNIANDGTYSATLSLDGETYALTTEGTYNSEGGFESSFKGTMNTTNDIEIGFYANYNGTVYYVYYINIPGHENATIEIYKETSDALVAVFEGKYKGDATGTFNMVFQGDFWQVVARDDDDPTGDDESYFEGSLDGKELVCDCGDIEITGRISDNGDGISGKWTTLEPSSGTWSGKRTL